MDDKPTDAAPMHRPVGCFIVVPKSVSCHCCFAFSILDTARKHETFNGRWHTMCECFDEQDAINICNALNSVPGMSLYARNIIEAIQAAIEYIDDLPSCNTIEAEAERAEVVKKLSHVLDVIDEEED